MCTIPRYWPLIKAVSISDVWHCGGDLNDTEADGHLHMKHIGLAPYFMVLFSSYIATQLSFWRKLKQSCEVVTRKYIIGLLRYRFHQCFRCFDDGHFKKLSLLHYAHKMPIRYWIIIYKNPQRSFNTVSLFSIRELKTEFSFRKQLPLTHYISWNIAMIVETLN